MTKYIVERWFIFITALVILFFALIMSGQVKAQYELLGKLSPYLKFEVNPNFSLFSGDKKLVTIDYKGRVIYEKDYNPDEASKAFWELIASKHDCK